MNVSSVSSVYSTVSIGSTTQATSTSDVEATFEGSPPPNVSKMGDLMNQLKELSESSPEDFKKVMAEISDKLKTEAKDATGDRASFLNDLADKFQQARESGDLSALKPPAHEHRRGAEAYGASAPRAAPQDDLAQIIQGALDDVTAQQSA